MPTTIRRAHPDDRDALCEVCLRTAASGADATGLYSHRELPGDVWAIPYLLFAPDHAFVLDEGDQVLGYVVGTPDTDAFERRLDAAWWPELRKKYRGWTAQAERDANDLDRLAAPPRTDPRLVARYPAHLHINILPTLQSAGLGRKLIETELRALRAAGASGVHLGCGLRNERAIGFYRHIGFREIERTTAAWFAMEL
jgi:ribosomal protein S18 acetylase RimI-like enzyme